MPKPPHSVDRMTTHGAILTINGTPIGLPPDAARLVYADVVNRIKSGEVSSFELTDRDGASGKGTFLITPYSNVSLTED